MLWGCCEISRVAPPHIHLVAPSAHICTTGGIHKLSKRARKLSGAMRKIGEHIRKWSKQIRKWSERIRKLSKVMRKLSEQICTPGR